MRVEKRGEKKGQKTGKVTKNRRAVNLPNLIPMYSRFEEFLEPIFSTEEIAEKTCNSMRELGWTCEVKTIISDNGIILFKVTARKARKI